MYIEILVSKRVIFDKSLLVSLLSTLCFRELHMATRNGWTSRSEEAVDAENRDVGI